MGQFPNDREVNVDALQHTLVPIWLLLMKMEVSRVALGRFIFRFFLEGNVKQVLKDGSWTFKGQLLLLKILMFGELLK
ncbi:DUF4283 domain-containing protein, partial [Vibrio vulnificus]|nr:DUF4283 domain-containing protein [Vibrio vulnificus]